MNAFVVLVKRELKSIRREKTIMFAILIQLFIASFSSIMLIGVMSFYDPTSIGENANMRLEVGVVGDTQSRIVDFVEDRENVKVVTFGDITDAEDAFRSGKVDTVMYIPQSEGGVVDMRLFLPESDTKSTLILMTLDEPFKKAENFLRQANGIQLNYADIEGKPHTSHEFLYSVIIPLLMLFPALIAGSIVIDTVSEELENKTLDTLWAAPVSLNAIFSSKVCVGIVTAIVQCILWVGLLRLNGFSVENLGSVLCLSILIAACISFGAAIIGLHFKDRERSQFVYSIALLALAGLSYLLDPSPFSLLTRLASGSHYVGLSEVTLYVMPVTIIGAAFFLLSKKLVFAQG